MRRYRYVSGGLWNGTVSRFDESRARRPERPSRERIEAGEPARRIERLRELAELRAAVDWYAQ